MAKAVSNTSPLIYLHRVGVLGWLPKLFDEIWISKAVESELEEGRRRGYPWLRDIEPRTVPSEWLTLDLGSGELATMALALENPDRIVLLDDSLARRIAKAAGIKVWGTLKILLEAKNQGLTASIGPLVEKLKDAGMWMSDDIRRRVLILAGEGEE